MSARSSAKVSSNHCSAPFTSGMTRLWEFSTPMPIVSGGLPRMTSTPSSRAYRRSSRRSGWTDKPIENPAALVNYSVTWIIDHRSLQELAEEGGSRSLAPATSTLHEAGGPICQIQGDALKGHRLVRQDGAVNSSSCPETAAGARQGRHWLRYTRDRWSGMSGRKFWASCAGAPSPWSTEKTGSAANRSTIYSLNQLWLREKLRAAIQLRRPG